jgi:hypothetical protein
MAQAVQKTVSKRKLTLGDIENLKPLMEDMNPHPNMSGLDEAMAYQKSISVESYNTNQSINPTNNSTIKKDVN